jgi:hypothetical protein
VRLGGICGCSPTCVRFPTKGDKTSDNQADLWAVPKKRERVKSPSDVQQETMSKLLSHWFRLQMRAWHRKSTWGPMAFHN